MGCGTSHSKVQSPKNKHENGSNNYRPRLFDTSSARKGSLSNAALAGKQAELTKASLVIQTYVSIILQQPDLRLDALPDLPSHQKTARDHAQNWDETMLPMIAKTATDIIKYANEFDSSYEFLVKYAKDIENPESKQTLIDELELLLSTIQNKDANAETVISDLTSFQKDLDTDYQNFQSDVNKAAEKIKGENGEIIALSGQIDAIHSAMYEGKWEMAGGGLMDIGGVIIIAVGPLCEIASGGSSTALIGGGVLVASGDVVMTTKASLDYRDKIDELETKTEQLKGDQTELAGLKATMAQVKGFVKGLETAITAVTSLQAEWQALDAHAQELMTAIEDANPGTISPWLVIKLKRAKKDWKVALDQANKLQPDGKVQTKLYENLKDAFREATCIQENP